MYEAIVKYVIQGPECVKVLLTVGWFTFKKEIIDKSIKLLSYLYFSNLNVPYISFQVLSI